MTPAEYRRKSLNLLANIERLLERQAYEARADTIDTTAADARGRDGYFSGVWGLGIPAAITLRWNPGTERLFPTTDQMAAAKSDWPEAEGWDFSVIGMRGVHYFGIPLNFHQT
jgi:hypothetical protein